MVVRVEGLVKRFGAVEALRGIDFEIAPGEIFGVIGPNGAGKTTAMRILLDILRPTSGKVAVLGADPRTAGPALRSRIGYLPGELRLPGRSTVASLLEFYSRISGGVEAGRVESLAARFDLDLTRQVRSLSKGNKQKLGVIQAVMHRPQLLVLDEPTSGLDPLLQREFLELIGEARDDGATVFLSSHVLSEVEHIADRVAILRTGEIVEIATVETFRRRAGRRVGLRLRHPAAPSDFSGVAGVAGVTMTDGWLLLEVEGDAPLDQIMQRALTFGVDDLRATPPNLEEAVLGLYDTEEV